MVSNPRITCRSRFLQGSDSEVLPIQSEDEEVFLIKNRCRRDIDSEDLIRHRRRRVILSIEE
jgi:hypothetical protein